VSADRLQRTSRKIRVATYDIKPCPGSDTKEESRGHHHKLSHCAHFMHKDALLLQMKACYWSANE